MEFLYNHFSKFKGGIDFVDSSSTALQKSGSDLVWWCGMVSKYHQHPDYTPESLIKTRKHFKNVALRYLNEQDYVVFKSWIENWSNMLIVTNYMDPSLWENYSSDHKTK